MRFTAFGPPGAPQIVTAAAIARGHVIDHDNPEVAYIRTCTFPLYRDAGLDLALKLWHRDVPTLPPFKDTLLYDNKMRQSAHSALSRFMPLTGVITDMDFALGAASTMAYPFVSKSSRGAGSHNVRLIRTREEAEAEIRAAFGAGIKAHRELQRGYLIWQEFIEGNDHDIRVVINGDNAYGLIRYNRSKDVPFASGSGKRDVITDISEAFDTAESPEWWWQARKSFETAREIAAALGTRWACFDFVFRGERCYVLEISFSWVESAYADCPCFDLATLEPNGHTAAEWATFAVMEMERLHAAR